MKKRFFTSNIFKFLIALSIVLGVFLAPISLSRENSSSKDIVTYVKIQKAHAAGAVNVTRGSWWNPWSSNCYDDTGKRVDDSLCAGIPKSEGMLSGLLQTFALGIAYIFLFIRALAALLLSITAWVLDHALQLAIGFDYNNPKLGISQVWTIIRDIFNVSFVFILLWAGITQIIGIAKTNTKQIIVGVVIAGLLINFSMFFARVLVDASNTVSTALYNQVISVSTKGTQNVSLSTALVQGLGIAQITIVDSNAFTTDWGNGSGNLSASTDTKSVFKIILLFVMQTVIYLVTAFAFISVCVIFIGRVVTLALLLALSPLGFLGTSAIGNLISKVKEASKWWWDEFTAQLFVIPIFLLLIIITIKISYGLDSVELNQLTEGVKTGSINFSIFLKFAIMIFLILKTVSITKESSGKLGQSINNFGSKAVGFGLGVATGGGAMLARRTIGVGLSNIAKGNNKFGNFLQNQKAKGSIMANIALRGAEKGAKSSFDVRNTESGKYLAKKTGIDANANIPEFMKAKKGGYDQAQKDFEKKQVESVERLKLGQTGKDKTREDILDEIQDVRFKVAKMKKPTGDAGLDKERSDREIAINALNSKEFEKKAKQVRQEEKNIQEKLSGFGISKEERGYLEEQKKVNDYEKLIIRNKELNEKGDYNGENDIIGGKAMKEREKETYEARAKDYAEAREKSILTKISRGEQGRKAAANAIREKVKSKTKEQKAVDAIKEMKDETEKEGEKEKSEAPVASKPASPPSEPKTT